MEAVLEAVREAEGVWEGGTGDTDGVTDVELVTAAVRDGDGVQLLDMDWLLVWLGVSVTLVLGVPVMVTDAL